MHNALSFLKRVDRVSLNDRQYGDLHIPIGMPVGIPIRYFHNDPEIWPEPKKNMTQAGTEYVYLFIIK